MLLLPWHDMLFASGQTIYMVTLSTMFASLLGLPLGMTLYVTRQIKPHAGVHRVIAGLINGFRSIPFIILLVAFIPLTRFIVGTSIGLHAAIVPLTIGAMPFFARLVDNAFQHLPHGLIETGHAMGASTWQMFSHILLPEVRPALIHALTVTAITSLYATRKTAK